MSNLPKKTAPLLAQALSNLLGNPSAGNMVYVQFLPTEIIEDLIRDSRFEIDGWKIALVSAREDILRRLITADRAVDWRESKGPASLLLIDSTADIPGIDGIKSAAREISETDLFTEAKKLARDQLPKGTKLFVDKILVQSRKVHRNVTPLCEFRYLCSAAGVEKKEIGAALHEIGLWRVDLLEDVRLEQDWLELSGQLVQRFFQSKKLSLEEQIESLYLPLEEENLGRCLAQWLHSVRHLSSFQALPNLEQKFWIHRIHPRFGQNFPNKIEFVSWRAKNQAPLKWSGLVLGTPDGDDTKPPLEWRIDPESEKDSPRLTVKWKVEPKDLQKGAAQYLVRILSGGRQEALSEKAISHSSTLDQKVVFSLGDLSELKKPFAYDAKIEIRVMGQQEVQAESEGFLIASPKSGKGQSEGINASEEVEVGARTYPNIALGVLPSVESWEELSNALSTGSISKTDKNGFVVFRWKGTIGKVFCPPLLSTLFLDWIFRQGMLGRWKQTIREDGSAVGDPEFIPITVDQKFQNSATEFSKWFERSQGPVSVLYGNENILERYVNDAMENFKTYDPIVTLIHTLEVSSLSGRRLGLIVLPTHPLRVAWQQGFDLLVACHHSLEKSLEKQFKSTKLKNLLEGVRGTYYPFLLPGIDPGECFVFADTLGPHAVALVPVQDPEPKSTVALLARLLLGKEESAAVHSPLVEVLGRQVQQYLNLHPEYKRILVHALRAGDARIVVRALGKALPVPEENEETLESQKQLLICYQLNLYPAESRAVELSGQFISDALDRKTVEDSWISDAVERPGGVSLPKLHWAKRNDPLPNTPAHIAVAFDLFRSKVVCQPKSELPASGVLEAHGLLLMPNREFFPKAEIPYWKSLVTPDPKGEAHPQTAVLTKRQTLLHNAILQATARHLGGSAEDWPVLVTEVNPRQVIENLHTLCDWVITTDRNAGIEYFDSPHTLPNLYDTHTIDCVPERDDLGFLQLVTSTTQLEEMQSHIGRTLDKIGLPNDLYRCDLLLGALKGISGRLALHISDAEDNVREMIALALLHEHCKNAGEREEAWLSLQHGFFVPINDVPELLEKKSDGADLLYVHFNERLGFQWTLVEVKFHPNFKTVRHAEVVGAIDSKLNVSSELFEKQYGANTTVLEKTIRRARLARILRFYARKGRRHHLTEEAFKRLIQKIDELVFVKKQKVKEIQIARKVGYIFCPEYQGLQPTRISEDIWMFGGELLREKVIEAPIPKYVEVEPVLQPDIQKLLPTPEVEVSALQTFSTPALQSTIPMETMEIPIQKKVEIEPIFQPGPQTQGLSHTPEKSTEVSVPKTVLIHQTISAAPTEQTKSEPPQMLLGYTSKEKKVIWRPSIRSNPHLMIVGKPGMGKTNCLINLCLQLNAHGISPIVFSYHSDIDSRIEEHLKDQIKLVKYKDLGFNPMQVPEGSTYLDSLGMLRDLFSAIFPGLGEVQLGRLRSAIKRSYQDLGWSSSERGEIPSFRTFFEILQFEEKPEKNLITRLSELDDYDVFEKQANVASLLEMTSPVFVQIHETQNEVLQRAFSTLTLYNLYQNMFLRGEQKEITHAIIFDEAHKAAKLKLIPRMAKECRKYGIVFVLASQGVKDFDPTLFSAIANYLTLCVDEVDAKLMAKKFVSSQKLKECADLIKKLPKYQGVYHGEGYDFAVTQLLEKVEDI
ncbi:DNA phosphorothioation-dependent restriction protein DptH [Gammaproteobacteria bacterium]